MDMQDVKSLAIPEGYVKTIHDKDNRLLWSAVGYGVTYKGDTTQQTYSGKNLAPIIDSSDSMNGLTLSASNGGLSITGTSSVATTFIVFNGVIYKQAYYQSITADAANSILLEAGTYTFSGNRTQLDCSAIGVLVDLGNNYGSGTAIQPGSTFTITEQKWFGFFVYIGGNKTPKLTFDDIMLEKSATATSYEPYCGGIPAPNPSFPMSVNVVTGAQTITISDGTLSENFAVDLGNTELCKIGTYQDYIYKSGDDWYVHKEIGRVVLDGTETDLAMYATSKFRISIAGIALQASGASEPPITMSDYFVGSNYAAVSAGSADNIMSGYYNSHQIRIYSTKWTTLADFQTWLSTHNTTVYYALAAPTDTQITDSNLISQLNAIHEWLTRYGYNATVTGNLPIVIDRTNL